MEALWDAMGTCRDFTNRHGERAAKAPSYAQTVKKNPAGGKKLTPIILCFVPIETHPLPGGRGVVICEEIPCRTSLTVFAPMSRVTPAPTGDTKPGRLLGGRTEVCLRDL